MSQSQRPRTIQRVSEIKEEDQMAPRKVPSNLMPAPLDTRLVSPSSSAIQMEKILVGLQSLAEQNKDLAAGLNELLLILKGRTEKNNNDVVLAHENYISRLLTVNSSKSFDLDVLKQIGRVGTVGYVSSDSGTINLKINEHEDITLNVGDIFRMGHLLVKKIRISTSNADDLTFRLFVM